jgi:hypothetical protein
MSDNVVSFDEEGNICYYNAHSKDRQKNYQSSLLLEIIVFDETKADQSGY